MCEVEEIKDGANQITNTYIHTIHALSPNASQIFLRDTHVSPNR
jgi:hypothetical protein